MSGEDETVPSAEAINAPTIERRKVPRVEGEDSNAYYLESKPTSVSSYRTPYPERVANGRQYLLVPNHRQLSTIEAWLQKHELPDLDETGQEIIGRLPDKPVYDVELETWLAWCYASKIEGLGVIASDYRSDTFHRFFVQHDGAGTVTVKNLKTVEKMQDQVFSSIRVTPPYDKPELGSLSTDNQVNGQTQAASRRLSYLRWGHENGLGLIALSSDQILGSYSELYYLLEKTTKRSERDQWPQVSANLALALALGVPRSEAYDSYDLGSSYEPVSLHHRPSEARFDELDGIMWFAVHVLGIQSPRVRQIEAERRAYIEPGQLKYVSDNGYDVLYPASDDPQRRPPISPDTAYVAMTRLYLQLDDSLKDVWNPILREVFSRVGVLCRFDYSAYIEAGEARTFNSYPEGDTSKVKIVRLDGLHAPHEIVNAVERYAHTNSSKLGNRKEIRTGVVGGNPDSETARYFDSSYDEHGRLVLTPKDKSEVAVVEETQRNRQLDVSPEARGVLPEIIRVVDEAMERPENADLDRFASIAAIMERVTGKEIRTLDVATMVSDTASLKGAVLEMMQRGLTRESLNNWDLELNLFEPDFAQMDFASQMLIILTTIGEKHGVPRQLIIEHMVETMAAAAPLVALRYMKLMEESIRDHRDDPDFELPVYDGATRIADAAMSEGWGSMEHMKTVVEEFGGLVSLLQLYHTYDATTTDMLAFLEQFEESGYAASQCGPFADILREIYTMMNSGPDGESTSHVVYRTMSRSIPLEQWLESLKRGFDMNFDHVKVVTPLDRPNYDAKRTRTLVTDQTSGEVLLADVVVDEGASRDLEHAVVLENPNEGKCMVSRDGRGFRRDVVKEDYLAYGARVMYPSNMTASIMGEIPELRHLAVLANPDHPLQITSSWNEIPEKRKWSYLNRMLSACPRSLADTGVGGTDKLSAIEINHANFLVEGVSRCVNNGHFAGAFFILDILDHKYGGVVDTDFGKTGQTVSDIFASRFAGQEAQFDAQLANAKRDGFITEDRVQKLKEVFRESEALRQKDSDLWEYKKDNAHIHLDRELTGMSEEIKSQVPESDAYKGTGIETEAQIREEIGNFAREIKEELQEVQTETDPLLVKLAPVGGKFAWPIIMRGVEPEGLPGRLAYVAGIVEAAMRCYNMPDSAYVALTDSLQEYDQNLKEALPKLEDIREGKVRIAMPLGVRGAPALMSGNDL